MSGEAASADTEAANYYPEVLKKITEDWYTLTQVFNVDERGLYCKRMPERIFIATQEKSMPGLKVAKDQLTLLLGGNAEGDFKLKPLVVSSSENSRAMRGFTKTNLPGI